MDLLPQMNDNIYVLGMHKYKEKEEGERERRREKERKTGKDR